jgi:tetratricopeptide (TPR) repeat protein
MIAQVLVCLGLMGACIGEEPATPAANRSADLSGYQQAQKEAGRDAKAHVRLALWCEQNGLDAERMKHLATAVLYDPSNGLARGLMGLVAYQGKWKRPDDVSQQVQDDPRRKALMQEYLQRRARTSDKADDQWRLAVWCEENGLKDQAIAQYHAVLRRDPNREAAWKRLGFKKVGGRWVKPEWQAAQKQESEHQSRANKHWKPLLEKWVGVLSSRDKSRRAEAEKGLAEVSDPRAVLAVWAVFAAGDAGRQKMAVRLLGQIDSPGSSRALAMLALMSTVAEVRQEATQILRRRDPRDFTPFLIGLLRDTIKYEVRRVNGPGSTGELLIKNPDVNLKRLYSPPVPIIPFMPGDVPSVDAAGLPALIRTYGYQGPARRINSETFAAAEAAFGLNNPNAFNHPANPFGQMGLPPAISNELGAIVAQQRSKLQFVDRGGPKNDPIWASEMLIQQTSIPIGQMMLEAQKVAQGAQQQLASDVQVIDAYNADIQSVNRCVRQILADAIGSDQGDGRAAWEKWMLDLFGYASGGSSSSQPEERKPTVVEQVPLAYQAQPVPIMTTPPQVVGLSISRHHACFGAGTPVQTIDGPRPIEDLLAGDEVLTQNPKSGELKYQALVAIYHNPPNATFRIQVDGESIVATGIHRLWKAGRGWTMVRELKPGDILRTVGGTATVKSVVEEKVQPVFNLRVADGESFFVGRSDVLAHDNSTINPTPEPFDAVFQLGESTAAKTPAPGR